MKSTLTISASRLVANFRAVQQAAQGFTVLCVLKANAYGHNAALCAPVLARAGAVWFGVADVDEGLVLRGALDAAGFPDARILVMCGLEPGDADALVAARLTPAVWTPEQIGAVERAARAARQKTAVHIEVDSGMARQGVVTGDAQFAALLGSSYSEWLEIEGVFSHLCCAEVWGSLRTELQVRRFGPVQMPIAHSGHSPTLLHMGNTSAVDEGSTLAILQGMCRTPMVRTGLALYGYSLAVETGADGREPANMPPWPVWLTPPVLTEPEVQAGNTRLHPHLRPVAEWSAPVVGLREIAPGESVGYGATWTAARPTRLALLPVGYADGFRREASSGVGDGWVMLHGRRAPVAGRVSMNLTVVDVTDIPAVALGDTAVLLGEGVTADDHARWCGTIPYEILCGMRGRTRLRLGADIRQ